MFKCGINGAAGSEARTTLHPCHTGLLNACSDCLCFHFVSPFLCLLKRFLQIRIKAKLADGCSLTAE